MCIIADAATGLVTCTLVAKATGFVNFTDSYCSDSGLKTPAAFCTFVTSCVVSEKFDQVGSNHFTEATLSAMPAFTFAALNSLPCASNTAATASIHLSTPSVTQALPFVTASLVERTGSFTTSNHFIDTASETLMNFTSSANTLGMSLGTTISHTNGYDSAFHAVIADFDLNANADSALVVDGTVAVSGATGSNSPSSTAIREMGNSSTSPLVGYACESSLWSGFMNSTDYGKLNTNMHSAAYGWNF